MPDAGLGGTTARNLATLKIAALIEQRASLEQQSIPVEDPATIAARIAGRRERVTRDSALRQEMLNHTYGSPGATTAMNDLYALGAIDVAATETTPEAPDGV